MATHQVQIPAIVLNAGQEEAVLALGAKGIQEKPLGQSRAACSSANSDSMTAVRRERVSQNSFGQLDKESCRQLAAEQVHLREFRRLCMTTHAILVMHRFVFVERHGDVPQCSSTVGGRYAPDITSWGKRTGQTKINYPSPFASDRSWLPADPHHWRWSCAMHCWRQPPS